MTIKEFKQSIIGVPITSDIVYFPAGVVENEDGGFMSGGIGYFDSETKELVYLGEISVIEEGDE